MRYLINPIELEKPYEEGERKIKNIENFPRDNELNILESDLRKKKDALKQVISHIEDVKEEVKLNIRQLKE